MTVTVFLVAASFSMGMVVEAFFIRKKIVPPLLEKQERFTRMECVSQVNGIAKNRSRYEQLKFRATEKGVSLDF